MDTANLANELQQYLTFFIAGEEYAVPILKVREVLEYDTITKVPAVPPCVRGVINLRGSVVPVIDIALKFGMPDCVITKRTCIVIVEVMSESERTVMGLMADQVSQVIELGPDDIEPAPTFGTRVRVDHLLGMGKVGKKFALMLDINRLLATDELLSAATFAVEQPIEPAPPPPASSSEVEATFP